MNWTAIATAIMDDVRTWANGPTPQWPESRLRTVEHAARGVLDRARWRVPMSVIDPDLDSDGNAVGEIVVTWRAGGKRHRESRPGFYFDERDIADDDPSFFARALSNGATISWCRPRQRPVVITEVVRATGNAIR